jgi:hypothetical protein
VRLALEHREALLRLIGLRVQRGQPARDVELLLLGGAVHRGCLDEQSDRGLRVAHPIEARARGLGEQRDPARRVLRGASGRRDAGRVALVLATLLGERAQLLLGRRRVGRELEQRGVVIHRCRQVA